MIIYHGSAADIIKPDLSFARDRTDFGRGFYTTPIKEQAYKWAKRFQRRSGKSYVSLYEINETVIRNDCLILEFAGYSDEWIDFVITCRNGNDKSDYDVVIGGVANDKVFNTIELYFDGLIEKSEALRRLKYESAILLPVSSSY
ncbi:MAG: DUF3990 domain-containing protein [Treponema sp.]|nr:DUF3990 domain-containing protein [Treponema sp.]